MKRFAILLLILCLLPCAALGSEPKYMAITSCLCNLRAEPQAESRKIVNISKDTTVYVLEYGDEWSLCTYQGEEGYLRSEWLALFRSLKPGEYLVPGTIVNKGIAVVTRAFSAAVNGYEGNSFSVGQVFCYTESEENVTFAMMRDYVSTDKNTVYLCPFIPCDKAQPGEMIGGFTTFYTQSTGGKMAMQRQKNIENGCRLLSESVLKAGEEFSFNTVCGGYNAANGYVIGPAVGVDGTSPGGGVCQLSTTLYNAILPLPLKITRRVIHRDAGVDYVPRHFDAAVSSYTDLCFENLLPYDIVFTAEAQNGILTVLVYRVK